MSTMPTMTELDIESVFLEGFASTRWVLVSGTDAIGPFNNFDEASKLRDKQFNGYKILELKDPEDVIFERGAHA